MNRRAKDIERASRSFLPIFGVLFFLTPSLSLAEASTALPVWGSVAVLGGTTQPDADLEKYQWSHEPQGHWGAQGFVGTGRWGLGLRGVTTSNRQTMSLPGADALAAKVRLSSGEALLRISLAKFAGVDAYGFAGGGRFQLVYDPDQLRVPIPGTNEVVVADLDPVDGWVGTVGLGLARSVWGRWGLGVEVDHHRFSLEAAHRTGDQIVQTEEAFGQWTARAVMSWRFDGI